MSILDLETQQHLEKLGITFPLKEEKVGETDCSEDIVQGDRQSKRENPSLPFKNWISPLCLMILLLCSIGAWLKVPAKMRIGAVASRSIYDPESAQGVPISKKEVIYWNEMECSNFFFEQSSLFLELIQERSIQLEHQFKRIQDLFFRLKQKISLDLLASLEGEMKKIAEIDCKHAEMLLQVPFDPSYLAVDTSIQMRLNEYENKIEAADQIEAQARSVADFFESGSASLKAIAESITAVFFLLNRDGNQSLGHVHVERLKKMVCMAALVGIEDAIDFNFCEKPWIESIDLQLLQRLIEPLSKYKEHPALVALCRIQDSLTANFLEYSKKSTPSLSRVDSINWLTAEDGDYAPSFLNESIIYPTEKCI
ncbi:MAG: hypothetical protein QRY74_00560 [Chlamydia sp.]